MWSTLVLLHGDAKSIPHFEIPDCISWHTCMRSVYLSDERLLAPLFFQSIAPGLQVYRGFDAYAFLLEIVCGLHSKLFGESEVQAQFKERFSENSLENSSLTEFLIKLRNQILEHSKIVRSNFLTGLGRQSYGGLCEKHIHNQRKVHLFGTGNLAESILPHLLNNNRETIVYGRNESRLKILSERFKIQTKQWEEYVSDSHASIIASSFFPEVMVSKFHQASMILDFRENDISLLGMKNEKYIPFSKLLTSIENTNDSIALIKPKVQLMIGHLTNAREEEQIHIMNGWEDLPQVCY